MVLTCYPTVKPFHFATSTKNTQNGDTSMSLIDEGLEENIDTSENSNIP